MNEWQCTAYNEQRNGIEMREWENTYRKEREKEIDAEREEKEREMEEREEK